MKLVLKNKVEIKEKNTLTVKKRESGSVAKTMRAEKRAMRIAQQPAPSASPIHKQGMAKIKHSNVTQLSCILKLLSILQVSMTASQIRFV